MRLKQIALLASAVAVPATASTLLWNSVSGGNVQPQCRTSHPNAYGYYTIGNILLNFPAGSIDCELWLEHPGIGLPSYSWAMEYQIPLQGSVTLTDALYAMFADAAWRTRTDIRESRNPKWMPFSSMEWLFAPNVKAITDTVLVGQPVFMHML